MSAPRWNHSAMGNTHQHNRRTPMAPRANTKTRALSAPVPQTRDEAATMLAEYGAAMREVTSIETVMNGDLAKVKQEAVTKAAPFLANAGALFQGLKGYCEAHRSELTDCNKLKT